MQLWNTLNGFVEKSPIIKLHINLREIHHQQKYTLHEFIYKNNLLSLQLYSEENRPFWCERKKHALREKNRNTEALASNRNMWSWQWPLLQSRGHNLMRGVGLPGSLFCLQPPVGEFGYLLRGWRFLRRSRGYLRFHGIPSGASRCPCLLWDRRL